MRWSSGILLGTLQSGSPWEFSLIETHPYQASAPIASGMQQPGLPAGSCCPAGIVKRVEHRSISTFSS